MYLVHVLGGYSCTSSWWPQLVLFTTFTFVLYVIFLATITCGFQSVVGDLSASTAKLPRLDLRIFLMNYF